MEHIVSDLKCKPTTELHCRRSCKAACVGSEDGTSSVAESCFNYLNSGVPKRIMFYNHGEWVDFPESLVQTFTSGFKNDKSCVTFSMGDEQLLLDFLSMVVVNLRTRKQRPVAWIDETNGCFFPTMFDQDDNDSNEWDLAIFGNKSHRQEVGRPEVRRTCLSSSKVVKNLVEGRASSLQQRPNAIELLQTKLEGVEKGGESFLFLHKLFLSGMGPFATPDNIIHIHRYAPKDINGQNKLESFERQIRITEEERGNANVRYGWFGSTKLDIVGVLLHGFGTHGKPTVEGALGTGVYLAPESRSFASVNLCDVDKKGLQFMILCRVILGKMEQVHEGSKQYFPSNRDYDCGVDNLSSPKCYVVWPTHLNRLHPEYLVTFKLASNVRDYLFGLKDMRFHVSKTEVISDFRALNLVMPEQPKGPISPWVSFVILFEALQDHVSPLAMELLLLHHQELENKIINREMMVKNLRVIVGDQLLMSLLSRLKRSTSSWYKDPAQKRIKVEGSTMPTTSNPDENNGVKTENNKSDAPTSAPKH